MKYQNVFIEGMEQVKKNYESFFKNPYTSVLSQGDFLIKNKDIPEIELTGFIKNLIKTYNSELVRARWGEDNFLNNMCLNKIRDENMKRIALYFELKVAQDKFTKIYSKTIPESK